MKILITGASGFLGHAVYHHLRSRHRMVALGHRQCGVDVRSLDLRDARSWQAELEAAAPDVVIHCAAYRDPDYCEREQAETRRLNITPVRVLVDTLPTTARIFFVSTDYVFDGEHPPYREDAQRRPINFYGHSKLEAEDIVSERTSSVILRIPLLMGCGPTYAASGFIRKMIDTLEDEEAPAFDDQIMRFPTSIQDVAIVLEGLLDQNDQHGVFHFSGPEGKTQLGWARELAGLLGRDPAVVQPVEGGAQRAALRPLNSQLATDRLKQLGFLPQATFAEVAQQVLAMRSEHETLSV